MSERRKLAAILAADVVGYSRLAGADEERTLARLRALAADPNSPDAHHAKALSLIAAGRFDEAGEEAQRAIALNPASMEARGDLCAAVYGGGKPEKVLACVDDFIRLSPRDPLTFGAMIFKGAAYLMLGKDREALEAFRRTTAINPNYPLGEAYVAATLALLGSDFEAHEVLARYLSMPGSNTKTIAAFRKQIYSDNPVYLAMREHIYGGLRKAGMPEK